MLGERVTVRKVNNRVVVSNHPKRKLGPPSDKQEAVQGKFLQAVSYARGQTADSVSGAEYARGISPKKRNAFVVAVSDYLNAPKVNQIKTRDYNGTVGSVILIDATDDFKVTRVKVVILGSNGKMLEQGDAVQDPKNANIWKYTARVANPSVAGSKVTATAFDMPDNEASLEVVL